MTRREESTRVSTGLRRWSQAMARLKIRIGLHAACSRRSLSVVCGSNLLASLGLKSSRGRTPRAPVGAVWRCPPILSSMSTSRVGVASSLPSGVGAARWVDVALSRLSSGGQRASESQWYTTLARGAQPAQAERAVRVGTRAMWAAECAHKRATALETPKASQLDGASWLSELQVNGTDRVCIGCAQLVCVCLPTFQFVVVCLSPRSFVCVVAP